MALSASPRVSQFDMPSLSPLSLQVRRARGAIVGRPAELAAIRQEISTAKSGRLTAMTLEGEPGIGKTRLLIAASEIAAEQGFMPVAVTADEEISGPFLLAGAIFACARQQAAADGAVQDELQRVIDAVSGVDEPGLENLAADRKLLRVFDLAALAVRAVASYKPLALLIDDVQWADEDSVRMLRYIVRANPDLPIFMGLAVRPEEMAVVTELTNLVADMHRMGLVRRLRLGRFTQPEAVDLLSQVLQGSVAPATAATMNEQAEGVPFILEELARTYRDTGMIQMIDGAWTLARNAARLVPSSVKTLIQRRSSRLPDKTRQVLAEAAILGRTFSLKDLSVLKLSLGCPDGECAPTALAEALQPAASAGLLEELPQNSPADYRFTHDQVKEFAAASLTTAERRKIHLAIVEMLTADGETVPASLPLLAHHAMAAGDSDRAAHFAVEAARAAMASRAPEEVLRLVEGALSASSTPADRIALLTARDDALEMLRRPADRLEGLAQLEALTEAMGDSHLELEIMLRRASALRLSGEEELAAGLAAEVRDLAAQRNDRPAELAAWMELGQALLRSPAGESFSPTNSEVDLAGAKQAYEAAIALAEELGYTAALASALRELGAVKLGELRNWYIERIAAGEIAPVMSRLANGETLGDILPTLPIASLVQETKDLLQRSAELFEKAGDRRGVMTAVIGMAYINFAVDIHLLGSARRIEEIRRLLNSLASLSRESQRSFSELPMLFGAHVFARAKGVVDLALSRGESAYHAARVQGDRSLEFACAGGVALVHLDLGEAAQAQQWLDRAALAASAAPTPLKARRLELWRALAKGADGDAAGMQGHFQRCIELSAENSRPADGCEALSLLALEAARLGRQRKDQQLLELAQNSAGQAKQIAKTLPGKPVWSLQAGAAMAQVHLAHGQKQAAAEAGAAALDGLDSVVREDIHLEIVLPAADAIIEAGPSELRNQTRDRLRVVLALLVQRIVDEDIRVRWFRGPVGRELTRLASPPVVQTPAPDAAEDGQAPPVSVAPQITDEESRLLWFLIEGRTNHEIAEQMGIDQETLIGRLAQMYGKIGATSPAEAAVIALRQGVV